jgi:nucleoside-diphosphate-sugar epimerase
MRILITGNLGYLGPCVTRQLRRTWPNARLSGIDTGYFTDCALDGSETAEHRIDQQFTADVRDLPAGVFSNIDAVVHLAALSNDPMGKTFEEITDDVNFRAGMEIARRAKKSGVKSFVFASSCSVYGSAEDTPRTEKSEINPLTAYARSKVALEFGLRTLAGRDFTVTCLRFATACGMSPRLRLDLVLNDFVASAVSRGEIRVLSNGMPWRPLIHVRDMARAIEWAVARPAGRFQSLPPPGAPASATRKTGAVDSRDESRAGGLLRS